MPADLLVFVALALVFNFLNGFHDSSNIVATIIFSRALSPRWALALIAAAELAGPFLFGIAVARVIGSGVVSPDLATLPVLLAAISSAILWNLLTWFLGIPSSSSHALVGGLIGAVWSGPGLDALQVDGLTLVLAALFTSPLIGFLAGYALTRLVFWLARNASLRINHWFKSAQILTGILLALSHSANDGQKTMGVIALGLTTAGWLPEFAIPPWVVALCALTLALGTGAGGWRLIRTLGRGFFKIRPVDGFSAQISSAAVILGAALLGGPVSTTQVVSSAILGVGAADRVNKVRWGVAGSILVAWFLTIPATALTAALIYRLFAFFGR